MHLIALNIFTSFLVMLGALMYRGLFNWVSAIFFGRNFEYAIALLPLKLREDLLQTCSVFLVKSSEIKTM